MTGGTQRRPKGRLCFIVKYDLSNLIKTARTIHDENPSLLGEAGKVRVSPVLWDVAQSHAAKSLAGRINPNKEGKYPIRIVRLGTPPIHLYSLVFYKTDCAVIELASMNPCWTRFCAAKELLHVYCGCSDGVADTSVLLKAAKASRFTALDKPTAEVDEETFCFYLAVEVMLPWPKRLMLSDMKARGEPILSMAQIFKIPTIIIDHYLNSGYAPLSFAANKAYHK